MLTVTNHIWQSTLCAGAVWTLTYILRKNRASVRFRLWLAASVKFLVPFSLLVSAGSHLGWRTVATSGQLQWSMVMDDIGRPFSIATSQPHLTGVPASAL